MIISMTTTPTTYALAALPVPVSQPQFTSSHPDMQMEGNLTLTPPNIPTGNDPPLPNQQSALFTAKTNNVWDDYLQYAWPQDYF